PLWGARLLAGAPLQRPKRAVGRERCNGYPVPPVRLLRSVRESIPGAAHRSCSGARSAAGHRHRKALSGQRVGARFYIHGGAMLACSLMNRSWVLGGLLVAARSEEHTSELQSRENLVCRLLLEKKNKVA